MDGISPTVVIVKNPKMRTTSVKIDFKYTENYFTIFNFTEEPFI
jgi:hypothetical protein